MHPRLTALQSFVTAALPLAALIACGEKRAGARPTFARDVAAIVYSSCTPCHRPGQPVPFVLLGYEHVFKRRDKIVEVTGQRLMPPWLPTHGDFVGDRRLPAASIEILRRWVEAGAPRGDAASEPPCPEFPAEWQLGPPDLVVRLEQEISMPEDGPDAFRNFVLPAQIAATKHVAAVEIRPGSRAVHHAVLAVDQTGRARRLDRADPEPGFAGMEMGGALPPGGCFLGWTPGKQPRRSPQGMSWDLNPGDDLVLQLHLTPRGKREAFRPCIGLYFTSTAPRVVTYPLCLFAEAIDLPAGAPDVAVRDHFVLPVPVTVRSIYPHAHYLCRRMAAWATEPGGARRDLFRIDRWSFDWQDDYTFEVPVALPAGSRIELEYHYDNSAGNPANPSKPPRHVQLGDRSTDEMGNLTLQVTTADPDARRVLGEASIRRDLEKRPRDAAKLLELAALLRETGRHDEALRGLAGLREREPGNADALRELGNCLAATQRTDEAERAYSDCLRLDPSQNVARVQLANLLLRGNRLPSAIALYEEALRLGPDTAAVRNNLATACMSGGQLERSERHFRRALELDPSLFQAWFNLGRVLAAAGRPGEAKEAWLRAQALRPGDARIKEAMQQLGR